MTASSADHPYSGCQSETTPHQDREILAHLCDRFWTAIKTAGWHNNQNHLKKVLNHLREFCIRAYQPHKGLPLTHICCQIRLDWLRHHHSNIYTRHVLFSEESWFTLVCSNDRKKVFRCKNKHYTDIRILKCDRHGNMSIMVWDIIHTIAHGFESPLVVNETLPSRHPSLHCTPYTAT